LDRSVHGPLVEEIKALLREFDNILICQVRRSGNEVAHRLAKEGAKINVIHLGQGPFLIVFWTYWLVKPGFE
jgi:hypothetical protein